jgi:integrase
MGALKTRIKTHPDAGLHGLRHTFLTEAGEHTDPFTLQYTAGHDNIKTTMRYVHPQANAVTKLFARLSDPDREVSITMRKVGAKSGAAPKGRKLETA